MVFLLHLINYHGRYIDIDNILVTIINHVFTKDCSNQRNVNHISNISNCQPYQGLMSQTSELTHLFTLIYKRHIVPPSLIEFFFRT
jgi:hypothetical protein